MTDGVLRVLVVAIVAVTALGAAWWANRHAARRAERRPVDVSGFSGRVLLFTDEACPSCGAARLALDRIGVDYVEISYAEHPEGLEAAGVESVPLLVVRAADGEEAGRIAGRPGRLRLRRLLARAGVARSDHGK
ncbi:MAG: glutaredoxin domain-containing protein [Acidimicrobiia bacterium]|nr:glutaredoxin domain-containing protein [Acidimicrobiia bacterium]